ncbi:response regulator [Pseudomonas koreensis]|uniref:response regulator transcription factor n=1 Tax=Pseudomonas koreensis TaxID=198620 RepID=UPI0021C5E08C|nr:response regulator [Pseudomonas koreensis]MCU0069991.1 response regulator [Pseudomonas koreensis]
MTQDAKRRDATVIAVVDDDNAFRGAVETLLRSSGYTARTFCSAREFLDAYVPAEFQCLISDIQMPGMSGLEMHERLTSMGARLPVIFITGHSGEASALGADQRVVDVLSKPCDADKLLDCIKLALLHQP